MNKLVYDIECLPNFFCVVFSELEGDKTLSFEISSRIDQRNVIISIIKKFKLIGYNSNHYDDILLEYLLKTPKCTNYELYLMSKKIIDNEKHNYKYNRVIESIDIMTMLASSKLRVSLKHLQVIIKWDNVLEFEVDWNKELDESLFDECIEYCINDVLSLKAVCDNLKSGFELRDYVYETTGLDCYSRDPVKIAEYTMSKVIGESQGKDVDYFIRETINSNEEITSIKVKDLILPLIKFKTDKFKGLKKKYEDLILYPGTSKKIQFPLIHEGVCYNFGLGGLHHDYKRSLVIKPGKNEKLVQADVSSFYPSIRIEHLKHRFDPVFLDVYKESYQEKKEAKAQKNKMMEAYAKLKLNSSFGLYNSIYSPFYSPETAYGTTINGQLMLAMLIEDLTENNFKVVGSNTDAVNVIVPDKRWDDYIKICSNWESNTKMGLDQDIFEVIYEHSCNNYIGIMEGGYIKEKGFFVTELDFLKGYSHPITKIALKEYFVNKIPIRKTIIEHNDIYDFCMSTRMGYSKATGKPFEAVHNGKQLQRTNRYYASNTGAYLYKFDGATHEHVLKDSGVTILNKYEKKNMEDYDINYSFYINAAQKIINDIEPQQLTLYFNEK